MIIFAISETKAIPDTFFGGTQRVRYDVSLLEQEFQFQWAL